MQTLHSRSEYFSKVKAHASNNPIYAVPFLYFSLHSNSPLDVSVKGAMISDLLNLSGFMIPDRRDILYEGSARR